MMLFMSSELKSCSREKRVEVPGPTFNKLLVAAHVVVINAGSEASDDIEEIRKRPEIARKEIVPFGTLHLGFAIAVEVDHLPHVRVVPTAKRHAWH